MAQITLVCGYRRTGKDTLAAQINDPHPIQVFTWHAYGEPIENGSTGKIFRIHPSRQISFARKLKEEVREMLDLDPDFDMEPHKDSLKIQGKLLRQHLIDHGITRREQDPNYWCKAAFEDVNSGESIIVTDWRFPNEYDYVLNWVNCRSNITLQTVRVFRKDVPIPPNTPSERSLDTIQTDFVLLPQINEEDERKALASHFPQYIGYIISAVDFGRTPFYC